ncbi:unnamed protein product [Calicophoron daubneyi]|uniref:Uncharacterized protein n=1 Tax=Calicophoron daubneyi TaxID=300641 RepID=A0AAV2T4N5_CALDB
MDKALLKLLLLLSLLISLGDALELRIDNVDKYGRIRIQAGKTLAMVCNYRALSLEGAILEWYLPSDSRNPVRADEKAYVYWQDEVNRKGYVLVVRTVTLDDSGKYTCRMGRQEGDRFLELARKEAEVIVERSIATTDCPREQWIPQSSGYEENETSISYFFQEDSVTIRCVIQALPPPTIHWRFKGRPITTGGSPPRITFGPRVVGPYESGAVVHNREAYLQCLAAGNPHPTVHWYRARDPQTELQLVDPQNFYVNTNGQVGMLRIVRAKFPDDSDVYICRALVTLPTVYERSQDHLLAEGRIQINVTLRPKLIPLTTMDRYVDLGDTVTVQCKIRGSDPLELNFKKLYSNKPLVEGIQPDDPRISVRKDVDSDDPLNHNIYLTIQNTTLDDTWNYTCHAYNAGNREQWNTTIMVMQTPQMIRYGNLPSTDERSNLRFGWRFNATNLSCASTGMPHPTWTWYRRGEQILDSGNTTFRIISWDNWNWSQSWLQIKPQPSNEHFIYDEYVCKATNLRGTNQSSIRLQRASVPGQPLLRSYVATQSTLELEIEPPVYTGGLPPLAYELSYTAIGGPTRWYGPVTFPLDGSTEMGRPRSRLTGLVGGTAYQLHLSARSIVGVGTPLVFFIRTLDATRPGPVEIKGDGYGTYPYSHVVKWIPPLTGGLPITGYRIRVRPVGTTEGNLLPPEAWEIRPKGSWQEFIPQFDHPYLDYYHITNLDPDNVYQVVVEAENALGRSLDGVSLEEYAFVNRTPSKIPSVQTNYLSNATPIYTNVVRRVLMPNVFPHDFVPVWYLFKTAVADPLGRPPRVYGGSSRHTIAPFLIIILLYLSTLFFP